MIDTADRLAIHELLADYGNLIDERQFSRTHELFTADARYVLVGFGTAIDGVVVGYAAIADFWRDPAQHPLAHHVTNVRVTEDGDGTVRVHSKIIGVGNKGRVGSATYHDVVVKTPAGWRMSERVITLRTPDSIPAAH